MRGNNAILNYQDILHFAFEFYVGFQKWLKIENNEGFISLKMFLPSSRGFIKSILYLEA